ncbi:hypothetical protein B0H14DRAFT_2610242 [Mycena olivaceomarginata]|nr:hypothetical protein B0H14DRAFT_2610242 [Mycena olivaceomarginata]
MTLAELNSQANSHEELRCVIPIVRKFIQEGRVISCSTRMVDPQTGETLLLYLGDRYGDDKTQYTNNKGLGDSSQQFVKPKDLADANIIHTYNKAVHAMAFVNPPKHDQTIMRHGPVPKNGLSLHRFPIAPEVKRTSDTVKAGLRNSQISVPGLVYSDQPDEGCEPSGVWYFIEGRKQIGHHRQDMCFTSSSTTAVGAMYTATATLESNVEPVVKIAFPQKY